MEASGEVNKGNQHSKVLLGNRLTPRQDMVLRLLARGMRAKEIQEKLNLAAYSTVSTTIKSICRNLDARTLEQAMVIWAIADYKEANEGEE